MKKIRAIQEYKQGQGSMESIGNKYGIRCEALRLMILKYDSSLMSELQTKHTNKKYPVELQIQAVTDYLAGKGSMTNICIKYNISSHSILRRWIMWYNGHKEFKERGSGTEKHMTKGRKTTQEERIEIVSFCIEHGKDYVLTIEKYGVSYQQIYSWVRKYEKKVSMDFVIIVAEQNPKKK